MNVSQSEQKSSKKIGEILRYYLPISEEDIEAALKNQQESESHVLLGKMFLEKGKITEENLAHALAAQFDLAVAKASDYPKLPILEKEISARFLGEHELIPLANKPEGILVATVNPQDPCLSDAFLMAFDKPILMKVALVSDFIEAYKRLYQDKIPIISDDEIAEEKTDEHDVEYLTDIANEAPVIRLVNFIIKQAVKNRASDIHIEPFKKELKIRHRIDGVLSNVEAPPQSSAAAVISRIKIMAKLDIAERRLPQDGQIKLKVEETDIDLRISTAPTRYGESVVIRILKSENVIMDFQSLGLDGKSLADFERMLQQPNGILLVTGPTGSGKTTTLYTALNKLNTEQRKILTVEDPIEYYLEGINQIQVSSKIGLTFGGALRCIVRQDPDFIMIGEIRDMETAKIAIQSALTGHLVLSTLHTNDAASSLTRLLDMGIDDYLITSAVNGVLAQRLVRRICGKCAVKVAATESEIKSFSLRKFTKEKSIMLYKTVGCEDCNNTGYHGRCVVVEMMLVNDDIRRLVVKRADATEIEKVAAKAGMITMLEDGIRKCLAGLTTIDELLLVIPDAVNTLYKDKDPDQPDVLPDVQQKAAPWYIHRTLQNGQAVNVPLDKQKLAIGRAKACDVCIKIQGVSRQHAAITIEDDRLFIEDLNSTNGTCINDTKITQTAELFSNDIVSLAPTVTFQVIRSSVHPVKPTKQKELVAEEERVNSAETETTMMLKSHKPVWYLERELEDGNGIRVPIGKNAMTIGRDKSCDMRVDLPSMSRTHAIIALKDNQIFVQDLSSANGTMVNGTPVVNMMEVKQGDVITLGKMIEYHVCHGLLAKKN